MATALQMHALEYLMNTSCVELGFCADCKKNMDLVGENFVCPDCGRVEKYFEQGGEKSLSNTRLVIKTTRGSTSTYNHTHDHSASRLQELIKLFAEHTRQYTGPAIPQTVLHKVAKMYVDLDRRAKEARDLHLRYRGGNKCQILVRMIYYGCIHEGVHRTTAEIASFMRMEQKTRFATGDNIVRKLQAANLIDIVVDETPQIIAARYIELFGLDPKLTEFVGEAIAIAQDCNIMMQSRMISKTIGVVWLLCVRFRAAVPLEQFEKTTGVRAPTFNAFINLINSPRNFCAFYCLYEKYGVPIM